MPQKSAFISSEAPSVCLWKIAHGKGQLPLFSTSVWAWLPQTLPPTHPKMSNFSHILVICWDRVFNVLCQGLYWAVGHKRVATLKELMFLMRAWGTGLEKMEPSPLGSSASLFLSVWSSLLPFSSCLLLLRHCLDRFFVSYISCLEACEGSPSSKVVRHFK